MSVSRYVYVSSYLHPHNSLTTTLPDLLPYGPRYGTLRYDVMSYDAMRDDLLRYTPLHCTVIHSTTLYYTTPYSTALYDDGTTTIEGKYRTA